jgi:hypothetical protein
VGVGLLAATALLTVAVVLLAIRVPRLVESEAAVPV